jgi:hypothetical protein
MLGRALGGAGDDYVRANALLGIACWLAAVGTSPSSPAGMAAIGQCCSASRYSPAAPSPRARST